jgi:hypothetical protein
MECRSSGRAINPVEFLAGGVTYPVLQVQRNGVAESPDDKKTLVLYMAMSAINCSWAVKNGRMSPRSFSSGLAGSFRRALKFFSSRVACFLLKLIHLNCFIEERLS